MVRGIGNYQLDSKDLPRGKEKLPIMEAALHAYGNQGWSEAKYQERHDYLKEYGSSTKGDGATRRRITTAAQHLALVNSPEVENALASGNIEYLNRIANSIGAATGSDANLVYDAIADKAAGETAGAVKGGAGSATDPGIEKSLQSFKASRSPQQRHDIAKGLFQILQTQAHTIDGAFTTTMGVTPDAYGQPVLPADIKSTIENGVKTGTGGAPTAQIPPGKFAARDQSGRVIGYADDAKGMNYKSLGQ